MPKTIKRSYAKVLLGIGWVGVAVVMVAAAFLIFHHKSASPMAPSKLVIGSGAAAPVFDLETVSTAAAQEKGLGGRSSLAPNAGMLFTYSTVDNRCMWMKDMRFNLDIVWLDASDRVTSIVANVSPGTYPQSYCAKAKYVVELNAGVARANALRVGQIVKL